jgi:hypothetical protein
MSARIPRRPMAAMSQTGRAHPGLPLVSVSDDSATWDPSLIAPAFEVTLVGAVVPTPVVEEVVERAALWVDVSAFPVVGDPVLPVVPVAEGPWLDAF